MDVITKWIDMYFDTLEEDPYFLKLFTAFSSLIEKADDPLSV